MKQKLAAIQNPADVDEGLAPNVYKTPTQSLVPLKGNWSAHRHTLIPLTSLKMHRCRNFCSTSSSKRIYSITKLFSSIYNKSLVLMVCNLGQTD